MKNKIILSIINILVLCLVIAAVSVYFISHSQWLGYVMIVLSVVCLMSLWLFRIKIKTVIPDIFLV